MFLFIHLIMAANLTLSIDCSVRHVIYSRGTADLLTDSPVGLCESRFILLDYSVEYLIEYSSTRWIPEVAINHRVVQSKRIPGFSFKFVV